MKTLQVHFVSDPGHAWLKVTIEALEGSGAGHLITRYSYIDRSHAYLEEDQDAGAYIEAVKRKNGGNLTLDYKETHQENTPIRTYAGYTPELLRRALRAKRAKREARAYIRANA